MASALLPCKLEHRCISSFRLGLQMGYIQIELVFTNFVFQNSPQLGEEGPCKSPRAEQTGATSARGACISACVRARARV
eukprot:4618160-Pleurochrysis_carterae.AAC.1